MYLATLGFDGKFIGIIKKGFISAKESRFLYS